MKSADIERHVPVPGSVRRIHLEHVARYRFASRFVGQGPVLDLCCGAGYGTAMLAAAGAAPCVGLDLSPAALAVATRDYALPRGGHLVGNAEALPFADRSFQLVVCLEAVEHLDDPERLLQEIRRVLRDDGTLVLSTPNRLTQDELSVYHRVEYSHDELTALLGRYFPGSEVLLQRSLALSLVGPPDAALVPATPDDADGFVAIWPRAAAADAASAVASLRLEELERDFQTVLDHAEAKIAGIEADRANLHALTEGIEADRANLRAMLQEVQADLAATKADHARFGEPRQLAAQKAALERELHEVLSSSSWRLLRYVGIAKK